MGLALTITTALFAIGSFVLILSVQARSKRFAQEDRRRVWENGTPATAKVVSATTNGSLKGNPRVLLHLEVTEPGKAPRKAQVTQVISQQMVGKTEPGGEITVRIDPADPTAIAVDPELTPHGY